MIENNITSDFTALHRKGLNAFVHDDLDAALSYFEEAAELDQNSAEFNHDYALALAAGWEYEAAVKRFTRAIEINPDNAQALNNLGNVYRALAQHDQAFDVYQRAEKLAPNSADIILNVGTFLEQQGQYTKAIRHYKRVVKGYPGLAIGHFHLAKALLAIRQPDKALFSVNRCLQKNPGQQEAIALKAVLLSELGQHAASKDLVDHQRFIQTFKMPVPSGYENLNEFHADLIDFLDSPEIKKFKPFLTATKNGLHTRNILEGQAKPVVVLKNWLQDIFRQYVENLPVDSEHLFLKQTYEKCRISAEAQLLDSSGFQETHLHDAAWVSGAYYISLPEIVKKSKESDGWLEFGHLPEDIITTTDPDVISIQPEEGMAALFPSYFYHGTRPFKSNKRRISIGIDLIPASR